MEERKRVYFKSEELSNIVEGLLKEFGKDVEGCSEKLRLEVCMDDFVNMGFVWHDPKTLPSWVAKVAKTPEYLTCLGTKQLVLMAIKPCFDECTSESIKRAIMYHELTHISFNEQGEYKLIDHNVKDFKFLVQLIGIDYEKASEIF